MDVQPHAQQPGFESASKTADELTVMPAGAQATLSSSKTEPDHTQSAPVSAAMLGAPFPGGAAQNGHSPAAGPSAPASQPVEPGEKIPAWACMVCHACVSKRD